MFHIVSKIFTFVLMPSGIICLLLLYSIYTKNRTKAKKSAILALIFFYLSSSPIIVNELIRIWEIPPTPISTVQPHDIGILLTGGTINTNKHPAENVFLGSTSDRIGQTIQLYKKGKIKRVLISGGDVPILGQTTTSEIDQIARYLMQSGVMHQDIFLESRSTNTYENAVNSAKILRSQFPGQSCLLITSGYHLRRAVGCFAKQGINVTPYGSDFISGERKLTAVSLLPSSVKAWHLAQIEREIIGYATYRIFGWL